MDCTSIKAALYIRVSTEEQALEGQSADAQFEILKQYCKLYNIEIFKAYKDLGVSGKKTNNRPGLLLMLNDASKGKFNMVLVWKISRLSRSLKDLLLIIEQLEQKNIVFCSYSEKFDTSNAVGRMTLQLLGSIAEFERNTIVDNVKLGLMEYARKGGKTGTVLGYDNLNKQLELNKAEAEIVKLIFSLYVEFKMSMSEIADYLNKRGYKTKRNKSFRKDSISVILNNPVYIGINRHNIKSPNKYQTKGNHEAIIESTLWKEAQKLIKTNKYKRPSKNLKTGFILSSKLICSSCGKPMYGFSTYSNSKTYRYYKCSGCKKLQKAAQIETKIILLLHKLLQNEVIMLDTINITNKQNKRSIHQIQLQNIQNELQSHNKLLDKYLILLEKDELRDNYTIIEKVKEIDFKLKQLEIEKQNILIEKLNNENDISASDYYSAIDDIFNNHNDKLKHIVELFINHINIDKDSKTGSIFFNFNIGNTSTINFDL